MSDLTRERWFRWVAMAGVFLMVGVLTLAGSAAPAKAQAVNPYCYAPYYNGYYCDYYGRYYPTYPTIYGSPYYRYGPYYYRPYGFARQRGFGFRPGFHHGFHGPGFHARGFRGGVHGGGGHGHR